MKGKQPPNCPITLVRGKWKVEILVTLADGPVRTGEIAHRIPNANPRVVARQLRSLEKDGLVQRKIYAELPQRVEYSLTERGRTTITLLISIRQITSEYTEAFKNIDLAGAKR